jgi:uncharacterized protein YnzC (UPF0291/DUF896 family)
MLFASLVFDREPLRWATLPDALVVWLQNAGGVSAFGIAVVLLARALQRDPNELNFWILPPRLRALLPVLKYAILASAIGYLVLVLGWIGSWVRMPRSEMLLTRVNDSQPFTVGDWILTLSGLLALFVTLTPIILDLTSRISSSRIWAIARLSWKEAVRGRVIWVFGSLALVALFADWFVPSKPEDQLRAYVRVVYWTMTPLFLITAGLLGAFSIPNDVKNNSIHTIVTKPVEKFEIVLGRFLGYAALLTVSLFLVSSLGLIYLIRGVNEEAKVESYKARIPLYGYLHFAGTKNAQKAESVGREWSYRSYITGPTHRRNEGFRQFAIWDFPAIPADVTQRTEPIVFEFSFDIFRLSKGEEGKGVFCTYTFVDVGAFSNADANRQSQELEGKTDQMKKEREKLHELAAKKRENALTGKNEVELAALEKLYLEELKEIDQKLLTEYRIFQVKTQEVTDQHTQNFTVPAQVLKVLAAENAERRNDDGTFNPALRVFVSVDQAEQQQMLGVAQQDFYLLAYEKPFWQNFLKGVIGMWCTHMLVLGVAIACSTYLSSVISLLSTMFLFVAGMFVDYLREIAENRLDGGGPAQSFMRITNRLPIAAKLEPSPTTSLITTVDNLFSWWIGRLLNLIPDVNRHDLHHYVANGFDIGWLDVLLLDNALPLAGYLAPWAILAYYLMKYREIANPS